MKFKDLAVGEQFVFAAGTSFPHTCVKTGTRWYATVEDFPHYLPNGGVVMCPTKCTVGTINVEVDKCCTE